MNIIYPPKGRAKEFAPLALNIYKGCTHGCRYCFNQNAPFARDYFEFAAPKKDVVARVRKDAAKLAQSGDCPEILISFVGDPYQPEEIHLKLTRQIIKILIEFDLPFTILTKGGKAAVRDFDLLEKYPKCSFGTTMILHYPNYIKYWEPYAAGWYDRWDAIFEAHNRGIKTWVSLEPVIEPDQALYVIQNLHPIVRHWKVGKINHMPRIENKHDWLAFRQEAAELLDSLGADYYLKKSLTEL